MNAKFRVGALVAAAITLASGFYIGRPARLWQTGAVEDRRFQVPHENPEAAQADLDPAVLLQLFGDALRLHQTQRYSGAVFQLSFLGQAWTSGDVRVLAARLGGDLRELARNSQAVTSDLVRAQAARSISGGREAEALLARADRLLRRDRVLLDDSRVALRTLAARLGIPALPDTALARSMYTRAEQSLDTIDARDRRLAALRQQIARGVTVDLGVRTTSVRWSMPDRAYLGGAFVVSGTVVTLGGRPNETRRLVFSLNDRVLSSILSRGGFRVTLTPPREFPPGWYVLSLLVKPEDQYPEAAETRILELIAPPPGAPTTVQVLAVPMAWVPGVIRLAGRVSSPSGPVTGATVEARLGHLVAVAASGRDGTFTGVLRVPLVLGFVGPQRLTVSAFPTDRANAPAQVDVRVFVMNWLNLGVTSVVFILPAAVLMRTRRRREIERQAAEVLRSGAALSGVRAPVTDDLWGADPGERDGTSASIGQRVIRLYNDAVLRIAAKTGLQPRPHLTLREYEGAALPGLRGAVFAQMTALAELVLYSPRPITNGMLEAMRRFRGELEEEFR